MATFFDGALVGAALAAGAALMLLFIAVVRLTEIRDHLNAANVQLALILTAARAQNKPFDAAMEAQGIDCFGGKNAKSPSPSGTWPL